MFESYIRSDWTYSVIFPVTWVLFIRNPGGTFFCPGGFPELRYGKRAFGPQRSQQTVGFYEHLRASPRWQLCRDYRFPGVGFLPESYFSRDSGKSGVGYRDQGVGGPWGITGHGFDYLVICFWSMISQWFILTQQTSAIQTWPFLCIIFLRHFGLKKFWPWLT